MKTVRNLVGWLVVFFGIMFMLCLPMCVDHAHAETWNHREYASIAQNSPAKSKFVQGAAYDGKKYAYVVKQNVNKHQMLWRVNMSKPGKPVKMSVSSKAKKAIYHGNDMAYVKQGNTEYLLVAPCKAKANKLVVLNVVGKKVYYVRSIKMGFTPKVSAITVVKQSGSKITAITGYGKHLWMAQFDLHGKTGKKLGRVYNYVSNQGITYQDGYLYACDGGYKTKLGNVRKYKVVKSGKNWTLSRQWVRQIKGEPECAFVDKTGKVCVAMEGKWHWNYSDRIVRWVR